MRSGVDTVEQPDHAAAVESSKIDASRLPPTVNGPIGNGVPAFSAMTLAPLRPSSSAQNTNVMSSCGNLADHSRVQRPDVTILRGSPWLGGPPSW